MTLISFFHPLGCPVTNKQTSVLKPKLTALQELSPPAVAVCSWAPAGPPRCRSAWGLFWGENFLASSAAAVCEPGRGKAGRWLAKTCHKYLEKEIRSTHK